VLVFVRAPEIGKVKTRLAREIGGAEALRIYRRLGSHAVAQADGASAVLRIHYTPEHDPDAVVDWLGAGRVYLPQPSGDLGDRIAAAFEAAFRDGHAPVVIVGSDIPDLSTARIDRALSLLEDHPVVVGPASDGGYWLLGLREPRPSLFRGIPWSTPRVLAMTLERLRAEGVEPALLPRLTDVDEAKDLPPGWL